MKSVGKYIDSKRYRIKYIQNQIQDLVQLEIQALLLAQGRAYSHWTLMIKLVPLFSACNKRLKT
jgi:hypothetical protein